MGHGILPLDLIAIADALKIPDGYKLVGANYDAVTRQVHFLVESSKLDEVADAGPLPRLHLMVRIDQHVCEHCTTTTTWVEKGY